jgi:hypothetical protein
MIKNRKIKEVILIKAFVFDCDAGKQTNAIEPNFNRVSELFYFLNKGVSYEL